MVNKDNKNNTNELFFDFTLIEDEDLWQETNLAFKDSKDDIPTLNNNGSREKENKSEYNKMPENLINTVDEDKSIFFNKGKDVTEMLYTNNIKKNSTNSGDNDNKGTLSQSVRELKKSDSPYVRAYYEELKTINKLKRSRRNNNIFSEQINNSQEEKIPSLTNERYDEKLKIKKDIFGKSDNVINKSKSNITNENIFKNLKDKQTKFPNRDLYGSSSMNNIQPLEQIKKEFNNTTEHDMDLTNLLSKINSINSNNENNKEKERPQYLNKDAFSANKNVNKTKMSRKLRRKIKENEFLEQNKNQSKDHLLNKSDEVDYGTSYLSNKSNLLDNNFDTSVIDLERIEQTFHTQDSSNPSKSEDHYNLKEQSPADIKQLSPRIVKRRDRKTNRISKSDTLSYPSKRYKSNEQITANQNSNTAKNNDNKVLQTILILIIIFIIAVTSLIIAFKFMSSSNQVRYSKPSITNKI